MFKKKRNQFLVINQEIEKSIKDRNFNLALALYNQLNEEYQRLENKEEYEQEFTETKEKLLILLKVEELLQVIKTNNLKEIKSRLNEIADYMQNNLNLSERFFTYLKHNYEHSLKIYNYKLYKEQLDEVIQKIYNFITEEYYEEALKLVPDAMKAYNQMSQYHVNEKIAYELEELKKHIKMSILKRKATAEPAKVDKKLVKKAIEKKKLPDLPEKLSFT